MNTKEMAGIVIGVFMFIASGSITNTLAQYENNSTGRVINNTITTSTGSVINYADEDNGLNARGKAAQQNVTGDYSFSGCMNSPIHSVKDIQAYCNGFMIGFNSGKCAQMRAQVTQMKGNAIQESNARQQLLDVHDIGQLIHQYNSQRVPPQSDKIYWVWR
jgi:hypothetical protein